MGLLSALNNAVSGLNINQRQLEVLSQNIANANTQGYSRQTMGQQASYIDGSGKGVSALSVTRTIDEYLRSEMQNQTSVNNSANVISTYYSQIQNLLGQPGTDSSIDSSVSFFFTAMQNLANSPSPSTRTNTVNTAVTLSGKLSSLARSLENLRLQADVEIGNATIAINSSLQTLHTVNTALERAAASNQSTAGLLDQRDAALAEIAKYIDIKPTFTDAGVVVLNTAGGQTLMNKNLTQLTYQTTTSADTFINDGSLSALNLYVVDENGSLSGSPVTLITGGASASVTTTLTGGKIKGLLTMRDSVLPNLLGQLDRLAGTLRDQVNSISNQGVSYPPPNSYTGTRLVRAADTSQFTGSVRIALLDSSGNPAASPYSDEPNGLQPFTLDLSTLNSGSGAGTPSMDGIIQAINQHFGPPQNKAKLGLMNDIQLSMLSATVPGSGNTLSFDFNLNNLSGDDLPFFVSGVTVLDNTGATVDASPTFSAPTVTLASTGTYQVAAANDTVTITTTGSATGLTNGQIIYLPAPPSGTFGAASSTPFGGYFVVSNVSGNTFEITVPGASADVGAGSFNAAGITGRKQATEVGAGETLRTGSGGTVTANIASNLTAPYYVVRADVATLDAEGNVVTSTISYRVPNNVSPARNNLVGANNIVSGDATIVQPGSSQPLVTASLVDADGNPLTKINGVYGNQYGYLKISANSATYTIAIDELDSTQLGLPEATVPVEGTGYGFSRYFGLNDFFTPNAHTLTGDTLKNSALNLSVTDRIRNNPGLIPTGKLTLGNQPASTSALPNHTYIVAAGDNTLSQQLASLSTGLVSFGSVTGMPASSTTFAQYAGQILAVTSANTVTASNTLRDSDALLKGYTERAQAVSGVNLDQELANTVIYQNAYTASTRVVNVLSELFRDLIGILG